MFSIRVNAPAQSFAWIVVSDLHGLKHLVSLIVTALADDDTVGTLTECADQELMHRKLALAL